MKTIYFILSSFILTNLSFGQDTSFVKVYYEDNANVNVSKAVANYNDGFIACGFEDYGKALLLNADSLGNLLWSKSLAIQGDNIAFNDVITTSDSCFLTAGTNFSNAFCTKFNQNGDTLWTHSFESPSVGNALNTARIMETVDSCYLLTWSDASNNNIMLVKLSANGTELWSNYYSGVTCHMNAIKSMSDSTIYLAGSNHISDGFLYKISADGNILWTKQYNNNPMYDLEFTNGQLFAAFGQYDIGVINLDTNGNVNWAKTYPMNYMDEWGNNFVTPTITLHNDTTLSLQSLFYGYNDLMVKIDLNGNVTMGSMSYSKLTDAVKHKYGGNFVLGYGPIYGVKSITTTHIGVVKTNATMDATECSTDPKTTTITNVNCSATTISASATAGINSINPSFDLFDAPILTADECVSFLGALAEVESTTVSVFPNSTFGLVQFELSQVGDYELQITTLDGKTVHQSSFNGEKIEVDLSQLSAGMYVYHLTNGTEHLSGRIIRE